MSGGSCAPHSNRKKGSQKDRRKFDSGVRESKDAKALEKRLSQRDQFIMDNEEKAAKRKSMVSMQFEDRLDCD